MNKKMIKLLAIGSTLITLVTPVTSTIFQPTVTQAATQTEKTVTMLVYKDSKGHKSKAKSMARGFVGTKAKVSIRNNHIIKLTIHVNGQNSKMGKGQDVDKIVRSLQINGANGHKANISKDHSSFDFVFPPKAFKNNGWTKMKVTINFGAKMTEQAWIKFGKVSGIQAVKKSQKVSKD